MSSSQASPAPAPAPSDVAVPPSRRPKVPKEKNTHPTPPPSKKKKTGVGGEAARDPEYKVGFVGCGNMARAIAEGMISSGEHEIASFPVRVRSACAKADWERGYW